jgi:hypothetical protein
VSSLVPGPDATFGVMFAESLRSSNRLTRSADTFASLAQCRPFADLRFRRPPSSTGLGFFVTLPPRFRTVFFPLTHRPVSAAQPSVIVSPAPTAGRADRSEAAIYATPPR